MSNMTRVLNARARVFCFYLPQFHPIPENDRWWGQGFTEWTNVGKARPLFPGHYQPQLPTELGYYDLRVPETREAQASLAATHGVEAFCFWHYWFGNGRRLLERPFTEILESGRPDFPFFLAWANQTWSGIWHGAPNRTLMEQTYPGPEDERRHFENVLPAFRDPRYVKVDERPLFVIYQPHLLPEPSRFIRHWQQLARQAGLSGIEFLGVHLWHRPGDLSRQGFNGRTAIRPTWREQTRLSRSIQWLPWRIRRRVPLLFSYPAAVQDFCQCAELAPDEYPTVFSGWDNTPRSGTQGKVYLGSTPELFEKMVCHAIDLQQHRPPERRIIFIRSWNEWAEGNILEPEGRWARGYLEALRSAVLGNGD